MKPLDHWRQRIAAAYYQSAGDTRADRDARIDRELDAMRREAFEAGCELTARFDPGIFWPSSCADSEAVS